MEPYYLKNLVVAGAESEWRNPIWGVKMGHVFDNRGDVTLVCKHVISTDTLLVIVAYNLLVNKSVERTWVSTSK